MAILHKPEVDQWYQDLQGRSLRVVAIDEDAETVDVQFFSGEIEEFEFDSWFQLGVEPIAEPEDWSGPFDDLEPDDMGDTEIPRQSGSWDQNLDETDFEE